jgi:hypothetical protein
MKKRCKKLAKTSRLAGKKFPIKENLNGVMWPPLRKRIFCYIFMIDNCFLPIVKNHKNGVAHFEIKSNVKNRRTFPDMQVKTS